jgi:hypothetical protein
MSMDGGTASIHAFNENESDEAEPPMGTIVDDRLRADPNMQPGGFQWE